LSLRKMNKIRRLVHSKASPQFSRVRKLCWNDS
jgi:hypothetical protein